MKTKFQSKWQELIGDWIGCCDCRLGKTRTNQVWGRQIGELRPGGLVFIGEGPGKVEDLEGLAFVGRAGKKLDRLLKEAKVENAYILNTVVCRPPANRDPKEDELHACLGRLQRQVNILAPKVVITLGRVATLWLIGKNPEDGELLSSHVGQTYQVEFADLKFSLIPTYHPSFILRRKSFGPKVIEHLELAKQLLEV